MMKLMDVTSSLLLVRSTSAQQDFLAGLPNCAVSDLYVSCFRGNLPEPLQLRCLTTNLPVTTCQPTDLACLCVDQNFLATVAGCNNQFCSVVEVLSATNATYAACGFPIGDQSHALRGISLSFGIAATIMIATRLVYRTFSSKVQLGWDDLLIAVSGVSNTSWFLRLLTGHTNPKFSRYLA